MVVANKRMEKYESSRGRGRLGGMTMSHIREWPGSVSLEALPLLSGCKREDPSEARQPSRLSPDRRTRTGQRDKPQNAEIHARKTFH